ALLKKIKRKAAGKELKVPMFVIGYAAPEPPPPGFLAAWFDQEYGGPLTIQLPRDPGTTRFEAQHGPWSALVETSLSPAIAEAWRERLQWSHPHAAQLMPLRLTAQDRRDTIPHVTRLARGLTLLTGRPAYTPATEPFMNAT